jgi:S-adenosylmethionine hydrolase
MIITLLTDFGTADGYVAAMKGVILSRAPGATLVDVTHDVPPQDVQAGAFALRAFYPLFPAGTVHLAVVDPGVGSARRPIAVGAGGQWFVGPDNGLFTAVYDGEPAWRALHLTSERFFRDAVSDTFHGRDIFAPVAAALASGTGPDDLGEPITDPVTLPGARVVREGGRVRGAVVHVDRFGNLITSLSRRDLPEAPRPGFRLTVAGREVRGFHRFYAEAAGGEPFATWGSAGLLEIAVDHGSAAALLGVGRGAEVVVEPERTDLRPEPRETSRAR